ncbi:metal-dependent hydrolase [Halogeometricum borinquense]|uniref:Metal-dependent hydrolase n=1 Tax=Halogeometricum borinquense TaxID=60847 RepID=A0A482TM91_9EURY|nr:metal-dependent hydrolase [Halogeometricum borinquense]RYJ14321.1 metal-dependent hydrolase [Halogeometricum borinquense]
MPSTIVHLAIGGLLGAALLGDEFDRRSVLVIFAFTALPDVDVFAEPIFAGAHRSLGHTFLLPAVLFAFLIWDTRRGAASVLRGRFGVRGVKLAWVGTFCLLGAGILPDLLVGGVNALYPLHDRFYTVDGRLLYSTDRGWVQTLVDLSPSEPKQTRTTKNFEFRTVLDAAPTQGTAETPDEKRVERIFPVALTGFRFGIVLLSAVVVPVRLAGNRFTGLFEE